MTLYTRPGMLEIINENEHKTPEEYLTEPSFILKLVAHPKLVKLFKKHGITRRGQYTWSLNYNDGQNNLAFQSFYKEYSKIFTPLTLHANSSENNENQAFSKGFYTESTMHLTQSLAMAHGIVSRIHCWRTISAHTRQFFVNGLRANVDGFGENDYVHDLEPDLRSTDLAPKAEFVKNFTKPATSNFFPDTVVDFTNPVVRSEFSPFVVVMTLKNNTLYFRLKHIVNDHWFRQMTADVMGQTTFLDHISGINYNLLSPETRILDAGKLAQALYSIDKVFGNTLYSENSLAKAEEFIKLFKNTLFVKSVSGKPNRVRLMNPSSLPASLLMSQFKKNGEPSLRPKKTIKLQPFNEVSLTLAEALDMQRNNKEITFLVNPSLIDVQRMLNSEEYTEEPRLYGYQRKAVGLQLATEKGFLNSLDTGIGKSIVQLTAMRERSKSVDNYRGLIVCQSNTKKQWQEYAVDDEWFPEAEIVIVDSGKKVDELVKGLSKTGPVIVIATFNMVAQISTILEERESIKDMIEELTKPEDIRDYLKTKQQEISEEEENLARLMVDLHWDDICADEATSIRNSTSSKQAKALWHLRQNSDRGVALTATPFNKSIDDIARLLEWVRNEKHMFYGNRLSNLYDQENITEENAKEIFESLYPMVFRFTKEEAQAEEKENIKIPKELAPKTLLLKPTPAELALSNACEYELKRILKELETALDNHEAKTDAEKAEVEAARAELKEAHGHWMAGTNVARMATSNPASILKSKSVAAQLLVGQGLVDNALQETPTKKKAILTNVAENVSNGKQILIFTDFVDVAKSLAEDFDEVGIRAGVFGGSNLKKRDENRLAFQNGELDVLVCTKAAERGLTLHKASVVYHYDMSWTLEPLLQKAGRAARVGSENEEVETYFLILEGTIEEKVVDKVFTQGTLSSMVLDKARGVDIKNTTTGKLMGGLMDASSNINSRKGALEFGKALLEV